MINCLLISEPAASEQLELFAGRIPFLGSVLQTDQPLRALDHINNNGSDMVFADIDLPGWSGMDFVRSLNDKATVIFIASDSGEAMQAFDLGAADYLLKPYTFERFVVAVNRAKEHIDFRKSKNAGKKKDYFFINISHKVHKIFYDDIMYLEGFKDYTKLYLGSATSPLLILHILKHFEDFLPADDFVRIHRSYIIPLRKINTVSRKTVTIGNASLPVSDNYRDKLFSIVG